MLVVLSKIFNIIYKDGFKAFLFLSYLKLTLNDIRMLQNKRRNPFPSHRSMYDSTVALVGYNHNASSTLKVNTSHLNDFLFVFGA